jgi:hypothetical protein
MSPTDGRQAVDEPARSHHMDSGGTYFMSILEKVKGMLGQHSDKAKKGIDKTGEVINEKTGGKYDEQVQSTQDKAKDMLDREGRRDDEPGQGDSG